MALLTISWIATVHDGTLGPPLLRPACIVASGEIETITLARIPCLGLVRYAHEVAPGRALGVILY